MSQRVIEQLTEAQCMELVKGEALGRFVYLDADGPAAVPVNFGLAGSEIVFRTEPSSHLRDMVGRPVAFEVDHTDAESGEGWSVLLRGTAREVDLEDVPELLKQMGENFPHPWAEGVHNVWVALTPGKITGRRLAAPYLAAIF